MEAQELLRKSIEIYHNDDSLWMDEAMAIAAGMNKCDFQNEILERALAGITRFPDSMNIIADYLDGRTVDPELDPYHRAVVQIAKDRACAVMQLMVVEAYMQESAEKCVEKLNSVYAAHACDQKYKAELNLIARAFNKSLEEIRQDVLNNPLSDLLPAGIYDEY